MVAEGMSTPGDTGAAPIYYEFKKWENGETFILICLWKEHISELKVHVRKQKIYEIITSELQEKSNREIPRSVKEVQFRIQNLKKQYCYNIRKYGTDQKVPWRHFSHIHSFMSTENSVSIDAKEEILFPLEPSTQLELLEEIDIGKTETENPLEHNGPSSVDTYISSSSVPSHTSEPVKKIKNSNKKQQQEKRKRDVSDPVLSSADRCLHPHIPADQFDMVGQLVASKLRYLPSEQRIYAEKLINDILYEAELNNLNRNCALLVNAQEKFDFYPQ